MTHELLKDFPVISATKVDWGDMDSFNHVNNTRYFRYFENARIDYGARIGILERVATDGIGPILAWTECKFIKPLFFPDTALTGIKVTSVEANEMIMEYKVVSEANNHVVAIGKSLGVYYNYREKRREDYPQKLLELVDKIEGFAVPRSHPAA